MFDLTPNQSLCFVSLNNQLQYIYVYYRQTLPILEEFFLYLASGRLAELMGFPDEYV